MKYVTIEASAPGRCKRYQVMRYVDGPAVALARSGRTIRCFVECMVLIGPGSYRRLWDRVEGIEVHEALERCIVAGYDPIAIAASLLSSKRGVTE